jgi:hypothetical protein
VDLPGIEQNLALGGLDPKPTIWSNSEGNT